jgi:hypothetical protein
MSFPKRGKFFPNRDGYADSGEADRGRDYPATIASALNRSLGPTRAGAKTVAAWTGANEKTVKNWFSGRYGPSGEHLVALARHSDEVLRAFLAMAGREDLLVVSKLVAAEQAITELLIAVRRLSGDAED